jgi:hypothetical protein
MLLSANCVYLFLGQSKAFKICKFFGLTFMVGLWKFILQFYLAENWL